MRSSVALQVPLPPSCVKAGTTINNSETGKQNAPEEDYEF